MAGSTSSRAAEVLDGLVRDQQRRPLFRRPELRPDVHADPDHDLDGATPAPGRRWDESLRPDGSARDVRAFRPSRSVLAGVAVLVALVGGLVGRQYLARPAALDDRLPIASEEPPPAGTSASGGSVTSTAASGDASSADGSTGPAAATATSGPVFVHVAGAVASPGVVELPAGSRVVDAVRAAGGLRPDADSDRVNLAAPLVDGSRVVVPALGQAPPAEVVTVSPAAGSDGGSGGTTGTSGTSGPIDLNTATLDELDELPGVGPSTAQAILDHRESEGPFTSVDALLDVRGIGDAKLEAIRDLVTVG